MQCVALHRYFDGFLTVCVPSTRKCRRAYLRSAANMHFKIQSGGGNDQSGLVDPHDPDGSRERLIKAREAAVWIWLL